MDLTSPNLNSFSKSCIFKSIGAKSGEYAVLEGFCSSFAQFEAECNVSLIRINFDNKNLMLRLSARVKDNH